MKSISISDNLHKWIMGHKDSEKKSAEKVIYDLIGRIEELEDIIQELGEDEERRQTEGKKNEI